MGYKIIMTDLASEDLNAITDYIQLQLGNAQAASAFLDAVGDCYDNLSAMPLMFEQCRDPRLRELGYRRAVIRHYVMVYRVAENEKVVYILRFFYGAREYENLI